MTRILLSCAAITLILGCHSGNLRGPGPPSRQALASATTEAPDEHYLRRSSGRQSVSGTTGNLAGVFE